jgi:NlpC/P60 family
MTTPLPGSTGGPTTNNGGNLNGLMGNLAGSNVLQTAIDSLTTAVGSLTSQITNLNNNSGNRGNYTASAGMGTGGGFPAVVNPMGPNPPAGGGQGFGNAGNKGPSYGGGFSAIASAAANYGNQQMGTQLGLNAYSTISQLGMNPVTGLTNGNALMKQAIGMGGSGYNVLSNNPFDALQMTQQLQFLGASPMYGRTALGRAGFGATAGFGLTNPTLGGSGAASLAQQLYSPQVSQNFLAMGYGTTPRGLNGRSPASMGSVMQSILKGWYNKNSVSSSQLYGSLSEGGFGYANLQALGLNPTQMAPVLEGYNQLFQKGYSANQAQALFTQAGQSGSAGQSARNRLSSLGVKTATSDIQALRNAQSVVTGRSADTANGFNSALQSSTKMLGDFNQMLNRILDSTGANNLLGYGGGIAGVLSGTNHATGALATSGMTAIMMRLLGVGGSAAGAGGAGGLLGGGGGATALGGIGAAGAGGIGAGLAGGFAMSYLGRHVLNNASSKSQHSLLGQILAYMSNYGVTTGAGRSAGGNVLKDLFGDLGGAGGFGSQIFGGSAGPPTQTSSQQSSPGGSSTMSMGVSGSSRKAVSAAESQLGVPYVWGGEMPGVGFDCSGLVRWAYKQAGVDLPRTSQQMWASLSRKSIPTNKVQEGDLVFMGGADGTANDPGHVALMISGNRLIQAPQTGQDVQIIGYNPREWSHAARPTGRGGMGSLPGNNAGNSSLPGLYGNAGIGGAGNYGSSNEVDLITSGSTGGGSMMGSVGNGMGSGASTGGATGSLGGIPGNKKQIAALARSMAAKYGWGSGMQWQDFVHVVNAESGWNVHATNPSSGAYGIPQALPGDKMSSAGPDWQNDPSTQLKWMFSYIKGRYGSPSGAWQHEQSMHWYGAGGKGLPGLQIVGDRGPELRLSGSGDVLDNAQSMALMKAVSAQPAQSPWQNMLNTEISGGQTIYPGQPASNSPQITVNFNQGSIVVHAPPGSDASASSRAMINQFVKKLHDEDVYQAIANGHKL